MAISFHLFTNSPTLSSHFIFNLYISWNLYISLHFFYTSFRPVEMNKNLGGGGGRAESWSNNVSQFGWLTEKIVQLKSFKMLKITYFFLPNCREGVCGFWRFNQCFHIYSEKYLKPNSFRVTFGPFSLIILPLNLTESYSLEIFSD